MIRHGIVVRGRVTTWRTAICIVLLSALAAACAEPGAPVPSPSTPPGPSAALPSRTKSRVVLYALEGVQPEALEGYLGLGTMPNLARLAERGVTAAYVELTDPALSAPSFASLSTGAFPGETGMVSDRFRVPGEAFSARQAALQQLASGPETVWRTAMRHGLETATVFWPSSSMDEPALQADYMVLAAESDAPSSQHVVALSEPGEWIDAPVSATPMQEGSLRIGSSHDGTLAEFQVLAVDQADDGPGGFDLVILDRDRDLSNGHVQIPLGEWAPVSVSPRLHSGAYFCFTSSDSLTVTVYQSNVSYVRGRPQGLVQEVNDLGFPPPAADGKALRRAWLSPEHYYEMIRHRVEWMTEVLLHVYGTYQPDLLLTAQDALASCSQLRASGDEGEDLHTLTSAAAQESYSRRSYALVDASLAPLLSEIDLSDTVFLMVSAAAMMPVHSNVYLNTILRDIELQSWRGGTVNQNQTAAVALASGGSAHIYLNLQGRDRPGIVNPEDYEGLQQRIVDALRETLSAEGEPLFARIQVHQELSRLHLDSRNSGDVYVQASPGYLLSDEVGQEEFLLPSQVGAAGGYDSGLPGMRGSLIAAGDGLARGTRIPALHVVDIAPTIADVLGVRPPATVRGGSLVGIWGD
jgi:predicted AlkP superfamily phosphohydrolase/phosphomutase